MKILVASRRINTSNMSITIPISSLSLSLLLTEVSSDFSGQGADQVGMDVDLDRKDHPCIAPLCHRNVQ
jgi:hypothetical protein